MSRIIPVYQSQCIALFFTILTFFTSCNSAPSLIIYHENGDDYVEELRSQTIRGNKSAYIALGDCYRSGQHELRKSMINSYLSYELAGLCCDSLAKHALKQNTSDEFGVMYNVITLMKQRDIKGAYALIKDVFPKGSCSWADILRNMYSSYKAGRVISEIDHTYINENSDDIIITALIQYLLLNKQDTEFNTQADNKRIISIIKELADNGFFLERNTYEIPYLNNCFGEQELSIYISNPIEYCSGLFNAIQFFNEGAQQGYLTAENAAILLSIYHQFNDNEETQEDSDAIVHSVELEDLSRLAITSSTYFSR